MTPVSHGKPCAGNPHARFEEGASAPETPRRNALLHNYAYIKNHPELFRPDGSLIQEQLKGLGDGYNSEPTQAETYSGC